jgi:hypothetical protein
MFPYRFLKCKLPHIFFVVNDRAAYQLSLGRRINSIVKTLRSCGLIQPNKFYVKATHYIFSSLQGGSIQQMGNVRKCHQQRCSMCASSHCLASSKKEWSGSGLGMNHQNPPSLHCCLLQDLQYMQR